MSNNILNERRTENVMDHSVLQDSEFDDALDVPDSLEITVNENDDTITVECGGDANSISEFMILFMILFIVVIFFIIIYVILCVIFINIFYM